VSGQTRSWPAYLALGLALRLWREAFPLVEGGTVILMHRFPANFAHPTQQPYRTIFHALKTGPREPEELIGTERRPSPTSARSTATAGAARVTRCCRSPTGPAARRRSAELGSVVVAGCRDAVAARQLGFVPVRNLQAGSRWPTAAPGGRARVGYLLSPPYFPLRVSA
jgi:hypothetical protein